jgi:hypothetical protein
MFNVFGKGKSVSTCVDWVFPWESEIEGHDKIAIIKMRKRGIFMDTGMIVFLNRLILIFHLKVRESVHGEIDRLRTIYFHHHI